MPTKIETTDLLPCPCCGAEASYWATVDTEWISCSNCGLSTDVYDYGLGEAKEAWNKRV